MKSIKPKTPAERVSKSEKAKKERGLRKLWVWAYPESVGKLRSYAKLLEKEVEEKCNVST